MLQSNSEGHTTLGKMELLEIDCIMKNLLLFIHPGNLKVKQVELGVCFHDLELVSTLTQESSSLLSNL